MEYYQILKIYRKGWLELRKRHQYHYALPIEDGFKVSPGTTTKDIKLAIYSLYSIVEKLNLK